MNTIYETKGAAKEYCEYAVDVFTGCPHLCEYCYAKAKADKTNTNFVDIKVHDGVLSATEEFLMTHSEYRGRTIFLGFSSDPFPMGYDHIATIDMIKLLKRYGCHIMFCTKGKIDEEVLGILDSKDSVGITITCGDEMASKYESKSLRPSERIAQLKKFYDKGIETWISIEPVLEPNYIYSLLESENMNFITRVKLGKLNHMDLADLTGNANDVIDWTEYGTKAIEICKRRNIEYIVKYALTKFL